MKKIVFLILFTAITSMNAQKPDIYKTKSGEYASKQGNFIVDFPVEPKLRSQKLSIKGNTINVYHFQANLGPNKAFTLEYFDYPDGALKNYTTEKLLTDSMNQLIGLVKPHLILQDSFFSEFNGKKGKYFVLELSEEGKKKGMKGYMEGVIFRDGNRVYTQKYLGVSDNNANPFINSFRLLE